MNLIIKDWLRKITDTTNQLKRQEVILVSVLISMLILSLILFVFGLSTDKDLETQKKRLKDYQALSKRYEDLKVSVDRIEKRATLSKGEGPLKTTQRLFEELGINKKLKSAKVTSTRELKTEHIEETVDIVAENMSLNEVVNLLYRVERIPMIVSVRSFNIKRSFENPDSLHLQMTVAYYSRK
ncbi:MAG: hypothetical protein SNJ53_06285 [Thermodesulfovibrionales bacterium]